MTFETLYERALDDVVRETHRRLFHGEAAVDMRALRSTVAARTRRLLVRWTAEGNTGQHHTDEDSGRGRQLWKPLSGR